MKKLLTFVLFIGLGTFSYNAAIAQQKNYNSSKIAEVSDKDKCSKSCCTKTKVGTAKDCKQKCCTKKANKEKAKKEKREKAKGKTER